MMCSVSLSPVMKMTGTCASALFCFSRRQVSKPSVPGMSASMRMTSGDTRSMIDSACSPSRATSTVMPASSIASVSIRSVSGESSTTSAISRVSFLRMGAADPCVTESLQRRRVALQVEGIHDGANLRDERAVFRRAVLDLDELLENPAHMSDLAQADQLVDVVFPRNGERRRGGGERGRRSTLGLVDPLDVQERMDLLEQLAQIDRLHQIVVVKALSLDEVALIDGIRRQYDHRGAFARGPPQAPRDLPAVHLGHGDVEQDQVRLVLLGEDQAFPPGRCAQDIESERGQQLPDQ